MSELPIIDEGNLVDWLDYVAAAEYDQFEIEDFRDLRKILANLGAQRTWTTLDGWAIVQVKKLRAQALKDLP